MFQRRLDEIDRRSLGQVKTVDAKIVTLDRPDTVSRPLPPTLGAALKAAMTPPRTDSDFLADARAMRRDAAEVFKSCDAELAALASDVEALRAVASAIETKSPAPACCPPELVGAVDQLASVQGHDADELVDRLRSVADRSGYEIRKMVTILSRRSAVFALGYSKNLAVRSAALAAETGDTRWSRRAGLFKAAEARAAAQSTLAKREFDRVMKEARV